MGFWSRFTRTAADIEYEDHCYRVELRLFSMGRTVTLLRDDTVVGRRSTPAHFELGDGAKIEVDATEHRFSKAILRTSRETLRLSPSPGTWEAAHRQWARAHPVADRIIGTISLLIVIAGLVLVSLQLVQSATSVEFVQNLLGGWSFELPSSLFGPMLVVIGVLTGIGALDRGLRMR